MLQFYFLMLLPEIAASMWSMVTLFLESIPSINFFSAIEAARLKEYKESKFSIPANF